jgi:hypothetical protein
MAAFDPATLDRWRALAIVDRDGTTVGTISEFYLDRETGHPTWAVVETGLFGATQTFVPLVHATEIADGLQVPYEKRHIKDSPRVDPHDELTPDEEATLFAHYGVDYEPLVEPGTAESAEAGPEAGTPEGPGPVPVDAATEPEAEAAAADAPGTAEEPGPVPAEPGTADEPGPVPAEPGTAEGPGPVPGEPGTTEGPGPVPEEPGTTEGPETAAGPDDATLITSDEFGSGSDHPEGLPDPDLSGSAPEHTEGSPDPDLSRPASDHPDAPDPYLSRTAPVEPGLPGSTAASPGPVPTTVDKDTADLESRPADDPLRDPDDSQWPPASAGSFEEHQSADRPAGASDHWREAKLAAERDRMAREAAQPEERSPLERARRRLERLVGVGQDHPDDDIPTPDQEAAERARRARLGFDEDDPRFR